MAFSCFLFLVKKLKFLCWICTGFCMKSIVLGFFDSGMVSFLQAIQLWNEFWLTVLPSHCKVLFSLPLWILLPFHFSFLLNFGVWELDVFFYVNPEDTYIHIYNLGGNEDLGRQKEESREAPPMADDYMKKSGSSLFSSPKLYTTQKSFPDPDSLMSPTSILDSKSFSTLRNPFWSDYSTTTTISTTPRTPRPDQKVPKPVGLGLVVVDDSLTHNKESDSDPNSKSEPCPVVLFGSQLKIQIPLLLLHHHHHAVNSPLDSPMSPADFGTKKSPVNSSISPVFSPCSSSSAAKKSPFGSSNSTRDFSSLSISEMELSEEYTRVISRGPNPKTTHIFDDCVVVESSSSSSYGGCCNNLETSGKGINKINSNDLPISRSMSYPSENFLSFCYKCKNNLGQGQDIYMYR